MVRESGSLTDRFQPAQSVRTVLPTTNEKAASFACGFLDWCPGPESGYAAGICPAGQILRFQPAQSIRTVLPSTNEKAASFACGFLDWCPGPESNRHALRRGILSPVRLPISPPGQGLLVKRSPRLCAKTAVLANYGYHRGL